MYPPQKDNPRERNPDQLSTQLLAGQTTWRYMFLRSGGYSMASSSYDRGTPDADLASVRGVIYFILAAAAVVISIAAPQTIPESVAYDTAEGIGFTDVKVVSRDWFFVQFTGCSGSDSVKFTVTGTNPAGEKQTFYVCAGLFKGGTPRFP